MSDWRCTSCGASYGEHFPFCARCWRSGSIVPWAKRPHAAYDHQPGHATARELARMQWRELQQSAYPDLRLGAGALLLISGAPGQGKSTVATRLLDSMDGAVLLVSAEEALGPALAARLSRCGVRRENFHVLTNASCDAVVEFARKKNVVALGVDSVTEAAWTARELRHVLEVVPSLDLLIGVLQVRKDGLPAGAVALQHESDAHVAVEGMRWSLLKSRYQVLDVGGDVLPSKEGAHAA